jgi:hypothetical protein
VNRHNGKLEKHNRIARVFYTNSLLKIHLARREKHHIFLKHFGGLPMSPRPARKALWRDSLGKEWRANFYRIDHDMGEDDLAMAGSAR